MFSFPVLTCPISKTNSWVLTLSQVDVMLPYHFFLLILSLFFSVHQDFFFFNLKHTYIETSTFRYPNLLSLFILIAFAHSFELLICTMAEISSVNTFISLSYIFRHISIFSWSCRWFIVWKLSHSDFTWNQTWGF